MHMTNQGSRQRFSRISLRVALALAAMAMMFALAPSLRAQNLGWEGETGVLVTPLAYTVSSEKHVLEPVVAYHYLNGGPVLGDFHQLSLTFGFLNRIEFGYTRDFHVEGDNPALSPLWHDGFNIFHAKALVVPENYHKQNWLPAISIGFMERTQVHNVGGAALNKDTNNGDIYAVASKVITQTKPIPIVLSGGVRGTNAELWGLAGNAPNLTACAFGAAALVFKGPAGSTLILGSEAAQQPHHPDQFPTLNIPTTITYAARFVPSKKLKLNADVAVAQIAGNVMPGVNLKARHQVGAQISYGF
jgi:hypothetical protein